MRKWMICGTWYDVQVKFWMVEAIVFYDWFQSKSPLYYFSKLEELLMDQYRLPSQCSYEKHSYKIVAM